MVVRAAKAVRVESGAGGAAVRAETYGVEE
jgi:hypothetical protein